MRAESELRREADLAEARATCAAEVAAVRLEMEAKLAETAECAARELQAALEAGRAAEVRLSFLNVLNVKTLHGTSQMDVMYVPILK